MGKVRLPSLNALRAFEAVGRLGRMTLAAGELNVTHGAVSRKVKELEASLGVPLLKGPKNRLELTAAGRTLATLLTPAFEQLEAAVRAIADDNEGVLDVSCLGTFTMRWLIPRLFGFNAAHPHIEVRLSASDSPVDFEREHYDIAIRVTDHPLPDAELTSLFAEQVGPVIAPDLARRLAIARPDDLFRCTLLHTKTRLGAWRAWAQAVGLELRPASNKEFEHFYFMLEAATAGLGACIAPWPLVIDDITAGRLVAPFGFVSSGQDYIAARRRRRNRKAEWFCAWLASEASRTPEAPLPAASLIIPSSERGIRPCG